MDAEVIIIGGGLAGATQALALAAHGLRAIVFDSANLSATRAAGFDGRVSAMASASTAMLGAIGVGETVEAYGCPIMEIRVTDGLHSAHVHFDANESDGRPLGHMIENRILRVGLLDALERAESVRVFSPASVFAIHREEGQVTVESSAGAFAAPLVVSAEGKSSRLRSEAGIRVARWSYAVDGLVTTIAHPEPHGNIAFQIFLSGGPLAILPMLDDETGAHRSAIVWSVDEKEAAGWKGLAPSAFARVLERHMDGFLGPVTLRTPVTSYPLRFQRAQTLVADRLALVGDAGHVMHPIAGQGLNVGMRDIAALTQVLVEASRLGLDIGSREVLKRYAGWRPADIGAIGAATDVLERLFRAPLVGPVRRLGLAAVNRIAPLKRAFMAGARGELGERPALLSGELA